MKHWHYLPNLLQEDEIMKVASLRRILGSVKRSRGSFKFARKSKRVASEPSRWYTAGRKYARRELGFK